MPFPSYLVTSVLGQRAGCGERDAFIVPKAVKAARPPRPRSYHHRRELLADRDPGPVGPGRLCPRSGGSGGQPPAAPCDAPTFTLRGPAPHAMLDVVFEGVFQTWPFYGALGAVVARHFNPNSVAREKNLGRQVPAPSLHHPRSFQGDLRCALRHTLNVLRSRPVFGSLPG